jgi:ABC-type transporter MlaC component
MGNSAMKAQLFSEPPILSVQQARKILGKSAASMTDEQIAELVQCYDEIAKQFSGKAVVKAPALHRHTERKK